MKIGLVQFWNARPLDLGFRRNNKDFTLHWDTPARLFELLKAGALDTALISSVECLRNEDIFSYCDKVGVCSANEARSILYLRKKGGGEPELIYTDAGSRSSVALLQVLLERKAGFQPRNPKEITDCITEDVGGLLIGDNALAYRENPRNNITATDLATWWFEKTGLPFVFALWAYPKSRQMPDAFFQESLAYGLAHMDEIIAEAEIQDAATYFKKCLHYELGEAERQSLATFRERLQVLDLL